MSSVHLNGSSASFLRGVEAPAGGPPKSSLNAETERSSGAIAAYMHQNGIDSVDPNQLFAMANNTNGQVPPDVQKAASFMLSHPKIYQKIETHDAVGTDGLSSVRNFDQAAQGNIPIDAKPQPAIGAHAAHPAQSLDERAQTAAGALGAYMHANDMGSVDPNQLYSLANNKDGNVPEDVQKAAKFMLKHPGVFQKIETSDVAGADGISGVGNFDKAAQGLMSFQPPAAAAAAPQPAAAAAPQAAMGTPAAASPDIAQQAQTAAGALGAYMHANNMGSVDPNQLYSLANNKDGNVPEDVQKAAKFMLKHPGVFQKIETSDVAGADGISGVGNFDKAAQGLTSFQPPAAAAAAPQPTAAAAPQAAMGTPTAASPDIAQQAQTAAGALGAYMHANNMGSVDPNQLYSLANNKDGNVPEDVQKAAKFMLKHPAAYQKIETSDVAGADGISGVGNFDKAAQGLMQLS